MKIRTTYTQWAVGQGFFHSGWIRAEGSDLEVVHVFDCGAQPPFRSALEREVNEFRARYQAIDLLFLSHFHMDHVSGLPTLLRERPAGHIVAPLLSPEERLLAFAISASDEPDSSDWPGWYTTLLANPEAGIGILSPETPVTWIRPMPSDALEAAGFREHDLTSIEGNTEGNVKIRLPQPNASASSTEGTAELTNEDRSLWMWVPWLPSAIHSHAPRFREFLMGTLPLHLRDLDDPTQVQEIVLAHRQELIEAYRSILSISRNGDAGTERGIDLNLTSLSLYCGPAVRTARSYRGKMIDNSVVAERAEVMAWGVRPGWLGTGDAPLKTNRKAADFNHFFRHLKAEVGTFAIPHHGSDLSWNGALLDGFEVQPTCVVGADEYHGWRHPGPNVVKAINDAGAILVVATAAVPSRWTQVSSTSFGHSQPD